MSHHKCEPNCPCNDSPYTDATEADKFKYKKKSKQYRENVRKYDGRSKEEIARLKREEKRGRNLW